MKQSFKGLLRIKSLKDMYISLFAAVFLTVLCVGNSFAQTSNNNPKVFNVRNFGAIPNDTLSDQTAIQNAMNAAYDAGGGIVYFPLGTYYLKDPLVTSGGTGIGAPYSQLYIKYETTYTGTGAISVKLQGEVAPPPNASVLANYSVNRNGVILYSTITGTGYYPSILGAKGTLNGTDTVNITMLTIDNINFRVKANIAASGPTMSCANLRNMGFVDIKNVMCDLDTSTNLSVYPVAETFGIWMPGQNNGAYSPLHNSMVTGYKYAYIFSEHSNGDNINAVGDEHAFVFSHGTHPHHFGRLSAQWCKYTITGQIGTVSVNHTSVIAPSVKIEQLDVEYEDPATFPSDWFANRYIIYDSINYIRGDINYQIAKRAVGFDGNIEMSKLGGTNIITTPLRNPVVTLTDGATITWDYSQATAATVTLGGNRTLVINNLVPNCMGRLQVVQDATGGRTLTPPNVSISDGITITSIPMATTASGVVDLYFWYTGAALMWTHADLFSTVGGSTYLAPAQTLTVGSATASGKFSVLEGSSRMLYNTVSPGVSGFERPQLTFNNAGPGTQRTNAILFSKSGTNYWQVFNDFNLNGGQDFSIYDNAASSARIYINSTGRIQLSGTSPTANLHLKVGTATASTAPLKFPAGVILTTPEVGAMETDASGQLYYSTSTTAASRGFVNLGQYSTTAVDVTATANMTTIEITVTGKTVTLPTAVGIQGRTYTIKLTASGSGTVATTSSQTIDGSITYALGSQNDYVTVQSNNANWIVINSGLNGSFRSNVSTYTNYTTTATYQNVASINLPAGDYEIGAQYTLSSNGATITAASDAIFVISTTTASAAGATEGESIAYIPQAALLGTSHESGSIVPFRVSPTTSTTYYFNSQATFTIGNPQIVGTIHATRVR